MSFVESSLCAALALVVSLPAAACTQRVEYPLSVEEATAISIYGTETSCGWGYVRYLATRVVDEAMKADLDASAAAGCRQTVRGPDAYGSVTAEGYATAEYNIYSDLSVRRPRNEKIWTVFYWADELKVGRFGGTLSQTHRHKDVNTSRLAGRAQVGDVLQYWSGGKAEAFCYGEPDAIADVGAVSYHWGDAPAVPVITIWRP